MTCRVAGAPRRSTRSADVRQPISSADRLVDLGHPFHLEADGG